MKKILQVNKLYYPWIGGVEKVVQDLAENINDGENFVSHVLCANSSGKAKEDMINGVRVFYASSLGLFMSQPVSFDFFRKFKKIRNDYDVIVIHHPNPIAFLAVWLFKPKGKIIIHYHSDIIKQRISGFLFQPILLKVLQMSGKIIISNPNMLKSSKILSKFSQKCEVIPFGIDNREIREKLDENLQKQIKEKYGDYILFVGRLIYYKGVHVLLDAIKDLDINLVIIGTGKLEKSLKKQVKNLGIENRVFFLGNKTRKEIINFYSQAEMFVLPSIFKTEAFGIVLIEAMSQGIPLISTELGTGTSYVNIDAETGYVVEKDNVEKLKQAIEKILDNKEIDFKNNCLKRIENNFTFEKFIEDYKKVYENI
ncbi:MAG TPA: glycosyltransferase [Candidatus Magasanikbacteria bacterium]|nr:glycosyltransferase [Candidatus Magasanikbacteria bacterium]